MKYRDIFRNVEVLAKKTNTCCFRNIFMDLVGNGPVLEVDVISKQNKTLVEITRFWADFYFTGHALELFFDILVNQNFKNHVL